MPGIVKGSIVQGTILIVDPIATNRIVLKVKLASAFYDVLQAATMAEALEIAQHRTPDLILSALCLPDGCAGQLSTALQQKDQTDSAVPVIAMAACADSTARRTRSGNLSSAIGCFAIGGASYR